jgi:predicted nucleic acid-binding protein
MSGGFIVDCSLTMSWCFPEEATDASSAIQDRMAHETAIVPMHWFLEVANVLAMAEKKKRITHAKSAEFLTLLEDLEIEADGEAAGRAFSHILALSRSHGLTSYDATYLDLALRKRLPLASLDDELRSAAKKTGIQVLGK